MPGVRLWFRMVAIDLLNPLKKQIGCSLVNGFRNNFGSYKTGHHFWNAIYVYKLPKLFYKNYKELCHT